MTIHDRLKDWRKAAGLRQEDVAMLSGIPINSYKGYEGGKAVPGGTALASLAKIGLNVDWLLTGNGAMTVPEKNRGDAAGAAQHAVRQDRPAYDVMERLRASTEAVIRLAKELEFEPSRSVAGLVQELIFEHGLDEDGARKLLAAFRSLGG